MHAYFSNNTRILHHVNLYVICKVELLRFTFKNEGICYIVDHMGLDKCTCFILIFLIYSPLHDYVGSLKTR